MTNCLYTTKFWSNFNWELYIKVLQQKMKEVEIINCDFNGNKIDFEENKKQNKKLKR